MSARKGKRRIGQMQYRRFRSAFNWRSAEDIAWANMAPVGMEFGSPDYERLMQEDFESQKGVFDPNLSAIYERDDGPLTKRQYKAIERDAAARFPRGKLLWTKSLFES